MFNMTPPALFDPPEMGAKLKLEELVPKHLQAGLWEYVTNGRPTGGLLRSILEDQPVSKVVTNCGADLTTYELRDTVLWIINFAPGRCWGSKEKVQVWLARREVKDRDEPHLGKTLEYADKPKFDEPDFVGCTLCGGHAGPNRRTPDGPICGACWKTKGDLTLEDIYGGVAKSCEEPKPKYPDKEPKPGPQWPAGHPETERIARLATCVLCGLVAPGHTTPDGNVCATCWDAKEHSADDHTADLGVQGERPDTVIFEDQEVPAAEVLDPPEDERGPDQVI